MIKANSKENVVSVPISQSTYDPLNQLRSKDFRLVKTAPLLETKFVPVQKPLNLAIPNQLQPSVPYLLSSSKTESSYFEIETLSEESVFEYQCLNPALQHNPPNSFIEGPSNMKSAVRNHRSMDSHFNRMIEEHLLGWSTSISQYNIDPVMNGKHPFAKDNMPTIKQPQSILDSFKNWFNSDSLYNSTDLCEPAIPNLYCLNDIRLNPTITLNNDDLTYNMNLLSNMKLKPNSSKSFITTNKLSPVNPQLLPVTDVQHTPIANPVYDFNFDKPSKQFELEQLDNVDNILNDNFLFACFNQCWSTTTNYTSACVKLF